MVHASFGLVLLLPQYVENLFNFPPFFRQPVIERFGGNILAGLFGRRFGGNAARMLCLNCIRMNMAGRRLEPHSFSLHRQLTIQCSSSSSQP